MSEQRHLEFVGQAWFSSTLLFIVDSAKLLTSQFLEVAAGIAAHPAAAGRWGIDDFAEQLRLMPNISPPMVTTHISTLPLGDDARRASCPSYGFS